MSSDETRIHAEQAIAFITVGMKILSHRVMTMISLLIGAAVMVWAASDPNLYRTIVAVAWWPLACWPLLWAERRKDG